MTERLALPLVAAAVQLGAAALALGRPEPALALAFLSGSLPSAAEALAAVELLVWAAVAGSVLWGVLALTTEAAPAAAAVRRRLWEASVAAAGLLVLTVGAAHHASSHMALSGGSVQEAQQAVGR
jgi:hypothetical protein